jgi:hypothetical protein
VVSPGGAETEAEGTKKRRVLVTARRADASRETVERQAAIETLRNIVDSYECVNFVDDRSRLTWLVARVAILTPLDLIRNKDNKAVVSFSVAACGSELEGCAIRKPLP